MGPSMRIVAFCGTVNGVCERIGFYAKPFGWDCLGPFILMRELVQRGRVTTKTTNETSSEASDALIDGTATTTASLSSSSVSFVTSGSVIVQQVIINLPEGIFRNVMKFLA